MGKPKCFGVNFNEASVTCSDCKDVLKCIAGMGLDMYKVIRTNLRGTFLNDINNYGMRFSDHIKASSIYEAITIFEEKHPVVDKDAWEVEAILVKKETEPNEVKTAPKNNVKEDKPKSSLIPWDILIEFLTPAYEEGLIKYARESWREGFKISDMKDALDRHITAFFYAREDYDPDAAKLGVRKHHLAGAMFCILSMLWTLKTRPELDDRPEWNKVIPRDPVEVFKAYMKDNKGVQQKKFDDDSKGHM